MKTEEIRTKHEKPIIGIIGATSPLRDYTKEMGIELGYKLRGFLEGKQGSLFTGGVPGVGADVYEGISKYCEENNLEDRFFVLVPEDEFVPPLEYFLSAACTKNDEF